MPEFLSNITPLVVFLGIGAIGFVFLLISLVIGDVFDTFGFDTGLDGGADGHALLDSRVISVFVTAFGGFGGAACGGYARRCDATESRHA